MTDKAGRDTEHDVELSARRALRPARSAMPDCDDEGELRTILDRWVSAGRKAGADLALLVAIFRDVYEDELRLHGTIRDALRRERGVTHILGRYHEDV
jgi:hypothetical protein